MGRGRSKAGNTLLVGMTPAQEKELSRLADNARDERTAQSMALGGFGGNASKKDREAAEKEARRLQGSMGKFERAQYETLKEIAQKNGIDSDFSFSDVQAKVIKKTEKGYVRVFADEYAVSSSGEPGRRWIADTHEGWNITDQKRFSTPEQALDYARKQK